MECLLTFFESYTTGTRTFGKKKLDVSDEKTNVTLSIKYIYILYSPILRTKLVITRVIHHLVGCKTHVTSSNKS